MVEKETSFWQKRSKKERTPHFFLVLCFIIPPDMPFFVYIEQINGLYLDKVLKFGQQKSVDFFGKFCYNSKA